jgi:hypothetical protein
MTMLVQLAATGSGIANYVEEVFSTYIYTGTSSTLTITNNIDLSTKGGLVWVKGRSGATGHRLTDTARGVTKSLAAETTAAQATDATGLTAFGTTGFTLGADANYNTSAATYASWTFREQSKFCDIVTYTGTGANTTIAHALGSVPGCIMVKRTDTIGDWQVYHSSLANTQYFVLNSTAAVATGATRWNSTTPTSTVFSLGTEATVNASGGTYVAYLFANDAGGFGLSGVDNVISCGSYTGNGSATGPIVTLGYEPQWLMIKKSSAIGNWQILDVMRGMPIDLADATLQANLANAETSVEYVSPTATGFQITSTNTEVNTSAATYIYMAVRRGSMKRPTLGTTVFGVSARSGTGVNATVTGGQVADATLIKNRGSAVGDLFASRLTGTGYTETSSTGTEINAGVTILQASPWDVMDGVKVGTTSTITNASASTFINYLFKRAAGFFDVVCYTGDSSSSRSISHNLTIAPEIIIARNRTLSGNWQILFTLNGGRQGVFANDALSAAGGDFGDGTAYIPPTSSIFTVSQLRALNQVGSTYIAYLFATVAGVSKVGSYTGTGTTLSIDCNFTTGARFVLIKRDGIANWYVWDTARGIVSGNDPYFLLDTVAAENTTTNYINTYSAGFELTSTAPAALNNLGGTYLFLAIA